MKTQQVILVIIALAGLYQAQTVNYCSCSDLTIEIDCLFHFGACSWDAATSSCSEVACDSRTESQCKGYGVKQTNSCVSFDSKCQAMKATCVEYTSAPFSCEVEATEGACEVDTAAESNKCKNQLSATTSEIKACNEQTTKDTCYGKCYFNDQKCYEKPSDCSGAVEAACNVTSCSWNDGKCQTASCDIQNTSPDCKSFLTKSGSYHICGQKNGVCMDTDPSIFTEATCHLVTGFTYHFDGSCKLCQVGNSTGSNGIVNTSMFGIMVVLQILMN